MSTIGSPRRDTHLRADVARFHDPFLERFDDLHDL
jgi:hypothetical protein